MPEIPSHIGNMPTWGVVAAVGAAGIVGYMIFFRKGAGGAQTGQLVQGFSGTTNPDYSASIGTLENQLLENQARVTEQNSLLAGGTRESIASLYDRLAANMGQAQGMDVSASVAQSNAEGLAAQSYYDQANQLVAAGPGATLNTISGQAAWPQQ